MVYPRVVHSIYANARSFIWVNVDEFRGKIGVHRDRISSPSPQIMVLEALSEEFTELLYADDLALTVEMWENQLESMKCVCYLGDVIGSGVWAKRSIMTRTWWQLKKFQEVQTSLIIKGFSLQSKASFCQMCLHGAFICQKPDNEGDNV